MDLTGAIPYQPYQNPNYQPPQPWANANTYAPWNDMDPSTTNDASFTYGMGGGRSSNYNPLGATFSAIHVGALPTLIGGSLGLFGKGKKRGSPDFYAPSYQGDYFMPAEGLPEYFGTSAEGGQMNAQQQAFNSPSVQQPATAQQGNNFGGTMDPMQNFVGQSIYGVNSSTYNPYNPSSSLGGYASYGGFSNSNTKPSQYQPFIPTGTGAIGQY